MYSQTFNNPFAGDPTSNAQSRYPDLSGSISSSAQTQFTSWGQPTGYANNQQSYPSQPGSYPNNPYPQQQQQSQSPVYGGYGQPQNYGMPGPTPLQNSSSGGGGFQPSSSFGQQMVYGSTGSYSYLQNGAPNPQQQQQYNHTATQQLSNPGYLAQFDPYASIGQGWDGGAGSMNNQNASGGAVQTGLFSADAAREGQLQQSQRPQHPRDLIRASKAQLESWDPYSWKQVFNSLDALKDSWDQRRKEIDGHLAQLQVQLRTAWSGMGPFHPSQVQQEISRLEGLRKDADTNHDSVAASRFQMQELQDGYRQSSDIASKRRVREASNAAIQGLPDWPSQTY